MDGCKCLTATSVGGIGWAIDRAIGGDKIARRGWNGKGMYVYLEPSTTPDTVKPCFALFTVDGMIQPGWLASQADMLATDWEVVG